MMEEDIKTYRKFECPFFDKVKKYCVHKGLKLRLCKKKMRRCPFKDIRKCDLFLNWKLKRDNNTFK